MIGLLSIALFVVAQPQEMVPIRINTRDYSGLRGREDILRGTCDGRPASATITKSYWGRRGRLVLRAGRWVREVPPNFLNGSLFSSGLKSAELSCDGRRLQLHALTIHENAQGVHPGDPERPSGHAYRRHFGDRIANFEPRRDAIGNALTRCETT
jgi:hypothetical protein